MYDYIYLGDILNKFVLNILFIFTASTTLFSQSILEMKYQDIVRPFLDAVINNDKEAIIDLIHYPLRRHYPIPYINNKLEMNERYDTIFDETLLSIIKNSLIETDWSVVGWRGITLGNGIVWIDYNRKIIAINYQSPYEIALRNNIILELRNNLHESLVDFIQPILSCETENYKIRIDLLNSNGNYRLALWSKEKKQSDIPDMVLSNGERISDGNGGNHAFVFNDESQYIVFIDVLTASEYGDFSIYNNVNNSWIENIERHHPLINERIIKIEM
jgi:hypothetical protein